MPIACGLGEPSEVPETYLLMTVWSWNLKAWFAAVDAGEPVAQEVHAGERIGLLHVLEHLVLERGLLLGVGNAAEHLLDGGAVEPGLGASARQRTRLGEGAAAEVDVAVIRPRGRGGGRARDENLGGGRRGGKTRRREPRRRIGRSPRGQDDRRIRALDRIRRADPVLLESRLQKSIARGPFSLRRFREAADAVRAIDPNAPHPASRDCSTTCTSCTQLSMREPPVPARAGTRRNAFRCGFDAGLTAQLFGRTPQALASRTTPFDSK